MRKFVLLSIIIISTWASAQTSYFITGAGNTQLHVQEFGSGKPIVLLAGGPGLNPGYLEPVWKNLSSRFRCIVLDQRGTGKSILSSVDSLSVNMKNYLADLEALRIYLKLDRLTLLGHSWGGMLSMEYAAVHPGHLEKLILLDPGGPTGKFFAYFSDNIGMRLYEDDKKEAAMLDSLKIRSLRGIWPGYFYDRKRALATKPANDADLFGQPGVNSFAIKDFLATEKERLRLLPGFKGVVHLIQGRQDPVGESTVYEIKAQLPQLQIHFIEQCGHLPWLENEAQVKTFFDLLHKSLE